MENWTIVEKLVVAVVVVVVVVVVVLIMAVGEISVVVVVEKGHTAQLQEVHMAEVAVEGQQESLHQHQLQAAVDS